MGRSQRSAMAAAVREACFIAAARSGDEVDVDVGNRRESGAADDG